MPFRQRVAQATRPSARERNVVQLKMTEVKP